MRFKPFTLIVDGKLQGYFSSLNSAKYALQQIKQSCLVNNYRIYDEGAGRQELVEEL
jgi:hypothetical protein